MDYMGTIIMVVLLVGVFYMMYRSNKKQERETSQMRNSLEVGDEITTIGGIIGEIIKIKEETVTIETGKDRTKIRILRSAVRTVDVHAYEKRGDGKKPEPAVAEKQPAVSGGKAKVKSLKRPEAKAVEAKKADEAVIESEKINAPVDTTDEEKAE